MFNKVKSTFGWLECLSYRTLLVSFLSLRHAIDVTHGVRLLTKWLLLPFNVESALIAKRLRVKIGQLYRSQTVSNRLWQVEFIYIDGHGIPHARLRDIYQQSETITLAAEVLSDTNRFKQEIVSPSTV